MIAGVLAVLGRHWQMMIVAVLAVTLVGACHQRDQALVERGAAEQRNAQMAMVIADLTVKAEADSARADSLSRVAAVDTVMLTRWLTRYDTLRDTLNVHDTLSVIRYVAAADSTIHACRAAVSSLSLSCAAKDTLIETQARTIAKLRTIPMPKAEAPSWGSRLLWVGIGAGLDRLLVSITHKN